MVEVEASPTEGEPRPESGDTARDDSSPAAEDTAAKDNVIVSNGSQDSSQTLASDNNVLYLWCHIHLLTYWPCRRVGGSRYGLDFVKRLPRTFSDLLDFW